MDAEKLARLDGLLDARDLAAVWFAQPGAFGWLTGGGNVVNAAGGAGVAAVGYDGAELTVVTNNIEAERLREEELPDGVPVSTYQWHEQSLADAVAETSATPAAADFDVPEFETVDPTPLRQPLTDRDIERYREHCETVAAALEGVCRSIDAGDTEQAVAGAVRRRLASEGINAPVVLVGGSERARRYRHYTPQDVRLGEYALLSVTARNNGMYASCTRTIGFDLPTEIERNHERAMLVDATTQAATRAVGSRDGTAGEVFEHLQGVYDVAGCPEEWHNHHQGGATGYAGREWIATPDHEATIELPMAFAWNPTVQGAKSEDTVLVREDGIETLTATGDWPTATIKPHDFDGVLDRHDILHRA